LRNFYDMLSVPPDAAADEIKKAFRREIARYHPDKVQHLGQEFQEMASGMAADLTEAYRILMDPALRAQYDTGLAGGAAGPAAPGGTPRPPASPPPQPPPDTPAPSSWSSDQAAARTAPSTAGVDFVRKASLSRLKAALEEVMGGAESSPVSGFDIAVLSRPKRGLFKKAEETVRLLVRFVPLVDAEAIADVWPGAMKARVPDATLCVLLAGSGMAPSKDLAAAINDQRRKSRNAGPVLVPVDVRDWEALFPPDTPAPVRSLIQRLKEQKR
jgi:curved DNA-binding protein CbpA